MKVTENRGTRLFLSGLLHVLQPDAVRRRRGNRCDQRPTAQVLEDRTLLAAFDVTTTADVINAGDGVLDRVFHAAAGISVTFNNMTIQNGQAFDTGSSTASALGGGLYTTGGSLSITNSTIQTSSATAGNGGAGSADNPISNPDKTGGAGGAAVGGGVYANSTAVSVTDSTIYNNLAIAGAAGIGGNGGNGSDVGAGGLDLKGTTLNVIQCTVSENGDTPGVGGDPGVDGDGSTTSASAGADWQCVGFRSSPGGPWCASQ